jgi:hypothetical protein
MPSFGGTLGLEQLKQFAEIMPGGISTGLRFIENQYLTEQEEYTLTVDRTTMERWILPLLHPVTIPFEPWVKTRTETRYRVVPAKHVIIMGDKVIVHPEMLSKIMRQFTGVPLGDAIQRNTRR